MFTLQNTVVCSLALAATAAALPTWSETTAGDYKAPVEATMATSAWSAPTDAAASYDWSSSDASDASATTAWPAPADTAVSSDWSSSWSSGWSVSSVATDASATTAWPAPTDTAVSSSWSSSWSSGWSTSDATGASATTEGSVTTEVAAPTDAPGGCAPPPPPPPSSDCSTSATSSVDMGSTTASADPSATSAPSATDPQAPSTTVQLTGVTHSVVAGLGGKLVFDPDNVVAEVGDVIEWQFLPANHTITQSSFDEPCKPLAGGNGFAPGFQFATKMGLAPDVFQIVVEDKKPIWYYCAQTKGNHCQMGMAGAINQDPNSDKNLANYKKAAALTGTSVVPEVNPNVGKVMPNPVPTIGL